MNIIVVMLDSLRPDFMGCYGNSEVKTPYMDAIAARGTAYAKAYAEYPITVPARTALVSGCYTFNTTKDESSHVQRVQTSPRHSGLPD